MWDSDLALVFRVVIVVWWCNLVAAYVHDNAQKIHWKVVHCRPPANAPDYDGIRYEHILLVHESEMRREENYEGMAICGFKLTYTNLIRIVQAIGILILDQQVDQSVSGGD
mmetsp:Transcript_140890/g.366748  ORF Transcript_140890/g.366748 Transcript_140890/m.366748 type:complete len:111 (+) Transcript_140890:2-334(+)